MVSRKRTNAAPSARRRRVGQAASTAAVALRPRRAPHVRDPRDTAPLLERRCRDSVDAGRPCQGGAERHASAIVPRERVTWHSPAVSEYRRTACMGQSDRMIPDDAAPLPGDLLLQAVEGMERPLFVLDERLAVPVREPRRGRAARADRRRDGRPGRLGGVPGGRRQPLRAELPAGRRDGRAGQLRGLVRPAAHLVPGRRVPHRRRAGASPTTTSPSGGGPRRSAPRRSGARAAAAEAAAAAAAAEEAGRHLMLLGRHQPGDDLDVRHRRGGRPVRRTSSCRCWPTGAWSAWSTPTAPGATSAGPTGTRRWSRRCTATPTSGWRRTCRRRRCPGCCASTGRWSSPTSPPSTSQAMVASPEARAALEPLQPARRRRLPAGRPRRGLRRPHPGQRPGARCRTPTPSCGRRRSPPAGRRSPWTTPGWRRPTSRWPSGCS